MPGTPGTSLIDPDEYDLSEERFAASLDDGGEIESESGQVRGGTRQQRHDNDAALAVAVAAPSANTAAPVISSEPQGERGMDDGAIWRQEVASRLESYRARRRRPIRERSLPLDFDRAVNREITSGSLAESEEEQYVSTAAAADSELGPEGFTQDSEPGTPDSKIIEFPRQPLLPVMPPSSEELAEPVIDRPRILDVSEEVETAAPLSDISVAPEEEQRPAVEFELPLQVAPMSQRVFAGLMDALIVLVGAAVFVMIVLKAGVPLPQAKAGFLLALAAPCLFWSVYEYMFLVYAGTTPGMQMARLQLITFDGDRVRRRLRRGRAVAIVLSTLSLGLGLIWALLDEDTLCWHDRITRTYVVPQVQDDNV